MPYLLDLTKRANIDQDVDFLRPANMTGAELNYTICALLNDFVSGEGRTLQYARIESAKGAVMGAVQEFHDRVVRPYEDRKAAENGDLPWPQ